jgi:hypothetical protein
MSPAPHNAALLFLGYQPAPLPGPLDGPRAAGQERRLDGLPGTRSRGCCDNSPGRHATAHFRLAGHPVIRSYEPGEDWHRCYLGQFVFELQGGRRHRRSRDRSGRTNIDVRLRRPAGHAGRPPGGHDRRPPRSGPADHDRGRSRRTARAVQEPVQTLGTRCADGQRRLARSGHPATATVCRSGTSASTSRRLSCRAPRTPMAAGKVSRHRNITSRQAQAGPALTGPGWVLFRGGPVRWARGPGAATA